MGLFSSKTTPGRGSQLARDKDRAARYLKAAARAADRRGDTRQAANLRRRADEAARTAKTARAWARKTR